MAEKNTPEYWADWLVDGVATHGSSHRRLILLKTTIIIASLLFCSAAYANSDDSDISPSICWTKQKLSPGLACWCNLKHEFHSGPPGTYGWYVKPHFNITRKPQND